MLSQIHIRDFAIVDDLQLDFATGMTVLTGETGAGKSILLDALALALGDRADSGVIRPGAERAEISVSFDVGHCPDAAAWLNEQELAEDAECVVRRTVGADGRSRGFINGRPAPMQSLRELGEMLVDIHGQHAHQSLLTRIGQRQALDDYAGCGDLATQVLHAFNQWRQLQRQRDELADSAARRDARLELLRYQTDELEALQLTDNEPDELEAEHRRLSNVRELQRVVEQTLFHLYENDDGAALDVMGRSLTQLEGLQSVDANLSPTVQLLRDSLVQAREAVAELRAYLDSLSIDPERLEHVEQRLVILNDLARKHHVRMRELPEVMTRLHDELATAEQEQQRSASMDTNVDAALQHYQTLAQHLSKLRRNAAMRMAKDVEKNIRQLGMPEGRFTVEFETSNEPAASGMESAEFLVTTNPGQPPRPLAKVASGGELSRISLALQVITAKTGRIPTLIFDEVDVGIGGGTAEIVGRLLRDLSVERQVLCVTHQPQVAALAHQHLQVSKKSSRGATFASVRALDVAERVEEVARMLGGIEITVQTRSHAQEMLDRATSKA